MMVSCKRRVLVAEDNSALASVVRFNLERGGFKVTVAADGREAHEILSNQQFDLIISDHQMPKMLGTELIASIRQNPLHRETPVILLTAKGLELDLAALEAELGLAATFAKPFSPLALVQVAHRLVPAEPEELITAGS